MGPLSRLCVHGSDDLRSTMEAIDASGSEIALVLDEEGRLLSTVSDGDIRRAILRGASLDDPIAPYGNSGFRFVSPAADRAEVLDLMQAQSISQVPVLDVAGRLVGLHLLRDIVGGHALPNVAVVMAGGQGTRLRPITEQVPKPMIRVAGRPILERIVLHLMGCGVRTIFIAVNYMADVIEQHFGDGASFGCAIHYLREEPDLPLGTAGALGLLPESVRVGIEPMVVMNGDLLTDVDVEAMVAHHAAAGVAATIAVRRYHHQVPFGVIEQDGGAVRNLVEKPTSSWLVSAGVYVVEPRLTATFGQGEPLDMTDLLAGVIARDEGVAAFAIDGDWLDVGQADDLRRARGELV